MPPRRLALHVLVVVTAWAAVSACGGPTNKESTKAAAAAPPALQQAPAQHQTRDEAGMHDVVCGCSLEEVGHCGEYVEMDGKFVELELPDDELGPMPFCGKDGLSAKVEGEMHGGKFVAKAFELEKK
ncbi:MAG: hypothetical protein V3V08_14450 [Nannocystaceae bacterium]